MRNVFHQYHQPENRLSHALASALHEDRHVLRALLDWSNVRMPARGERLQIVEQQVPGVIEDGADEERGLPDVVIFGDAGFCLLIESKIAARISLDQLQRHRRTAERAGFPDAQVLVLATGVASARLPAWAAARSWPALYTLMIAEQQRSAWGRRLVVYMEVLESALAQSGYLREDTLTQFSGIRFDEETPYSYAQAKRLIRLLMSELRSREDLQSLGVVAMDEGRTAITGAKGHHVWDFIRLRAANSGSFTTHPHLTLSLHPDHIGVMATLPNGAAGRYRAQLLSLGHDGVRDLVCIVAAQIERATRKIDGARPVMYVVQRHFASQRAKGIEDARLSFDLRTATRVRRGKVHLQPEWIGATCDVLCSKKSNLQVGIGAEIPYASSIVRSREALDVIAEVWVALGPWLHDGLGVPRDES